MIANRDALTFTFSDIRDARPCELGWRTAIAAAGIAPAQAKLDTTVRSLSEILDSNCIDDALWVLDCVVKDRWVIRLLSADYAERVLHIFEEAFPGDPRPRNAIETARNPDSTGKDLAAARDAACDAAWAAARAASGAAAWAAAWDAAKAASGDAARAAAWAAAKAASGDAASYAAWAAARDAAGDVAWDAAWAAAWDAAWAAQSLRLRQYIKHGADAAKMPWEDCFVSNGVSE